MHTAYKSQISPGVNLTCVQTDKFKTGCLSINLITSLSRDTAALSALLPRVLRRGCANLPDMDLIAAALDELYGARIEPIVRKKGEMHCIGLFADFPDDRFIPNGVLEETSALLGDILLSPALDDGLLHADYVESEKNNLIDDIRAGINDKRGYSVDRLLEEMCVGEAFGVNRLGDELKVQEITPQSLTAHYYDVIKNARVEVFYCGADTPARVEATLIPILKKLPARTSQQTLKTEVLLNPAQDEPRRFTEELDVSQGKLTIGFRLGHTMENPDYPALMVFNAVYGGNVTSKLFLNVREKLSLCYYASSMLEKHKGIMIVASGVEFSKFDEALDEILSQLEHVKNGEIEDWEMLSARRSVTTAIKSAMDRPAGLEDLYFDSSLAAVHYDPDKLCSSVEAVTLDMVIETASGIKTDSIYFLTGRGGDENGV